MKLECEMNDVMDVMCMYIAAVYGSSHTATHATRRVRGVCCYSNAHLEVSDRQGGITVPHVARVSTVKYRSIEVTSRYNCMHERKSQRGHFRDLHAHQRSTSRSGIFRGATTATTATRGASTATLHRDEA